LDFRRSVGLRGLTLLVNAAQAILAPFPAVAIR
jgi:hypothetical protein